MIQHCDILLERTSDDSLRHLAGLILRPLKLAVIYYRSNYLFYIIFDADQPLFSLCSLCISSTIFVVSDFRDFVQNDLACYTNEVISAYCLLIATRRYFDFSKVPLDITNKLFNSVFLPILLYGSEVRGTYEKDDLSTWEKDLIEKTHIFLCKQPLGVNNDVRTFQPGMNLADYH